MQKKSKEVMKLMKKPSKEDLREEDKPVTIRTRSQSMQMMVGEKIDSVPKRNQSSPSSFSNKSFINSSMKLLNALLTPPTPTNIPSHNQHRKGKKGRSWRDSSRDSPTNEGVNAETTRRRSVSITEGSSIVVNLWILL